MNSRARSSHQKDGPPAAAVAPDYAGWGTFHEARRPWYENVCAYLCRLRFQQLAVVGGYIGLILLGLKFLDKADSISDRALIGSLGFGVMLTVVSVAAITTRGRKGYAENRQERADQASDP